MKLSDKFKQWQFSKHRVESFSDAVFAIVITLLVLELKIPKLANFADTSAAVNALKEITPKFFSWVISFFFVAIIWLHHHNILHMADKSDYGVIWINNFLLFFVSFLPFPTGLMGEYPHQPLYVMLWGVTVSVTTMTLSWFYFYNTKNYLRSNYNKKSVMRNVLLSLLAVPLIYLAAAFLAWYSIYVSFFIYAFVPLLYLLPLDIAHDSEKE